MRAKLEAIVADRALAQTQAHLNDLKALVDAGTASQADLLRVESQAAHAELVAVKSRHLSQLAEDHLRTLMHDPPNQGYVVGESFNAAPSADRQVPKLEELLRTARARRPEFRALEEAEQARRSEASAERNANAPRLDLFAGATYANPNSRIFPQEEEWKATWQAGAKLSITLTDIPGTSARARSIDAKAASLAADRSVLADGVRTRSCRRPRPRTKPRSRHRRRNAGCARPRSRIACRKLLFANGRAATVEVLDAETDLTQARYEAVEARIDRGVARAQLARAVSQVEATFRPNNHESPHRR